MNSNFNPTLVGAQLGHDILPCPCGWDAGVSMYDMEYICDCRNPECSAQVFWYIERHTDAAQFPLNASFSRAAAIRDWNGAVTEYLRLVDIPAAA